MALEGETMERSRVRAILHRVLRGGPTFNLTWGWNDRMLFLNVVRCRESPSPLSQWSGTPTAAMASWRPGYVLTSPSGLTGRGERASRAYEREGQTWRSGNTYERTVYLTRSLLRRHQSGMGASLGGKFRSESSSCLALFCPKNPSFHVSKSSRNVHE